MITAFSKMLIYTASYIILYPILILRILFEKREIEPPTLLERVWLNFQESSIIILVLVGLLVVSLIVLFFLPKFKADTRCKSTLSKNVTYELTTFLLPYFFSIITIDLDWWGWLVYLLVFLCFGAITIMADFVYLCPVFILLKYKLFVAEDGRYIYTRLSKEQYNQLCADEINGIEGKILTANLVLIKRKKI